MTDYSSLLQTMFKHIIDARHTHAEFIDRLTLSDGHLYKLDSIRFPVNQTSPDRKAQLDKAMNIAQQVMSDILFLHQHDITFDVHQHSQLKDIKTLADIMQHAAKMKYSIGRISRYLSYGMAFLICNLPETLPDDFDWLAYLKKAPRFLDPLTDYASARIVDERECCNQCAQPMNLQLNFSTMSVSLFAYYLDDDTLHNPTDCAFPDGLREYQVAIPVKSQQLVIANNLTAILPEQFHDASDDYIFESLGHYVTISEARIAHVYKSKFFAALNIMYLFAGNSSPAIFRDERTGTIQIKSESTTDSQGREIPNYSDSEILLGHVCTDLWATTTMCMNTFIQYCQQTKRDPDDTLKALDATVVDIENGTYRAVNHYFDDNKPHLFVTIEKIPSE